MAKFVINGKSYPVIPEKTPSTSLFKTLYGADNSFAIILNGENALDVVMKNLDFVDISPIESYETACIIEDDMRQNMYLKNSGSKYFDPHYGLKLLDVKTWENISYSKHRDDNLLFKSNYEMKQWWTNIQSRLEQFKSIFQVPGIFIAGGAIYSILFGLPISDIDLFIYGCNEKEAEEKIYLLSKVLRKDFFKCGSKCKKSKSLIRVVRTTNAITFICPNIDIQVVLRLYKTPSEIIHGFDVDCCSVGYDGKDLWMTHRAWFALENGYNTVNFNRLSPSYEYRLAKYGSRGMAIKIKDFDKSKINTDALDKDLGMYGTVNDKFKCLKDKTGLDILLCLDRYNNHSDSEYRATKTINLLVDKYNDYSPKRFDNIKQFTFGAPIEDVVEYLVGTKNLYPKHSESYMPYFNQIGGSVKISYCKCGNCVLSYNRLYAENICINNVPRCKKITFAKCSIKYLKVLLHIPQEYYIGIGIVRPWTFTADLQWKITNPGEQMTGTFHRVVLEDNNAWYCGSYYQTEVTGFLNSGDSDNKEISSEKEENNE